MLAVAFQAESYYSQAQQLLQTSRSDDAALRSAISRAYYSALIVARDAKGISTRGQSGHQAVINGYSGNAAENVVADSLRKLRALREKADYQPKATCVNTEGHHAIAHARKVLSFLRKLPATP